MDVYCNGDALSGFSCNPSATLAQAIEALELWLDPTDVVLQIGVDGESFVPGDPAFRATRSVAGIGRLDISTLDRNAVVADLESDSENAFRIIKDKLDRVWAAGPQPSASTERLLAEALLELRLALELDAKLRTLGARAGGPTPEALEDVVGAVLEAREAKRGNEAWTGLGLLCRVLAETVDVGPAIA